MAAVAYCEFVDSLGAQRQFFRHPRTLLPRCPQIDCGFLRCREASPQRLPLIIVEELEQEKEDIINQIVSIKGEGSAQLVTEFKLLADDMISMQQRLGAAVWALHIVNEEIYRSNTDKKATNGTSNNL